MKSQMSRPDPSFLNWVVSLCLCVTFTLFSVNSALAIPQGAFAKKLDTSPSEEKSSATDIEDINIPEDIGLIKETFKGKEGKLIVHIQDAHCNYEAQTNIAKILEILMEQKGLVLVALEGSAGEIDTSLFTTFPDEEIRKEVATYFMKKGKICGAEHLAINTKKPILLYGIENKDYYLENLEAFTTTLSNRPAAKKVCGEIKTYLNKLKQYIYNKELKALDNKIDDYNQDKIKFVDFCTYLHKKATFKKINLRPYENFSRLIATLELEKTIDFNKVEDERTAIISELEKKLSQEELSDLLKKSLSYKQKKITGGEYYTYLKALAEKAKIKPSDFKNFNSYVNYIDNYTRIDNSSLFRELKDLQEDIKESLYTDDDQRKLNRLSKDIGIITDLVDISLSKDESGYLLENSNKLNSSEFTNFIQRQASRYALAYSPNPNVSVIDEILPTLEKFYQVAHKREDALLENTLNKMDEKGYRISVLISGGFHTEGLTQRLKDRGISYIVVAPRITDLDAETPYLEILSGGEIKPEEVLSEEE